MKLNNTATAIIVLLIVMSIAIANVSAVKNNTEIKQEKAVESFKVKTITPGNFFTTNLSIENVKKIKIEAGIKGCAVIEHKKMITVRCPQVVAQKAQSTENRNGTIDLIIDLQVFPYSLDVISPTDISSATQIGVNRVWQLGYTGKNVKIGIIDTGVYPHKEFADRIIPGWNFANNNFDTNDVMGHGTHITGIIASNGTNPVAIGIAPQAKIQMARVYDENIVGYFSWIIQAIYWFAGEENEESLVDVISASLGTSYPNLWTTACDDVYPELTEAINYAISKGVVVVVAAGNYGDQGVGLPGCISTVITVGATDQSGNITSWSSKGSPVDIVAPGEGIFSTIPENDYAFGSGTSMSTPQISGVVALLKSAKQNLSIDEIETALYATADDRGSIGKDSFYGWGQVNAYAAMLSILPKNQTYKSIFAVQGLPSNATWSIIIANKTEKKTYTTNKTRVTISGLQGETNYTYDRFIANNRIRYVCNVNCAGNISNQTTVIASYKTQYSLKIVANKSHGATSPAPGDYWYDKDSKVTISATPLKLYAFDKWLGTGPGNYSGLGNPITITMRGPITETASFVSISATTLMHVEDIIIQKKQKKIKTTVRIADGNKAVVKNAYVRIQWYLDGEKWGHKQTALTDKKGNAVFYQEDLSKINKKRFVIKTVVIGAEKAGMAYDESANRENSASRVFYKHNKKMNTQGIGIAKERGGEEEITEGEEIIEE